MGRNLWIAAAAAIIIATAFLLSQNPHPGKEQLTITNSGGSQIRVYAEIADEWLEMEKGLMNRTELGEYEGMLFIFPQPDKYGFWMKDTLIPLDAVFISENGTIGDIMQMEPCGEGEFRCPTYSPKEEALYVLELNGGFCESHGIKEGDSIGGIPQP
jgi:hypothetical protein